MPHIHQIIQFSVRTSQPANQVALNSRHHRRSPHSTTLAPFQHSHSLRRPSLILTTVRMSTANTLTITLSRVRNHTKMIHTMIIILRIRLTNSRNITRHIIKRHHRLQTTNTHRGHRRRETITHNRYTRPSTPFIDRLRKFRAIIEEATSGS